MFIIHNQKYNKWTIHRNYRSMIPDFEIPERLLGGEALAVALNWADLRCRSDRSMFPSGWDSMALETTKISLVIDGFVMALLWLHAMGHMMLTGEVQQEV